MRKDKTLRSLVGPKYLKSLRGPLPDIPMMPTGGVSVNEVVEWFAAGAWTKKGRFTDITFRAEEFAVGGEIAFSSTE